MLFISTVNETREGGTDICFVDGVLQICNRTKTLNTALDITDTGGPKWFGKNLRHEGR